MLDSIDILRALVREPTISRTSNLGVADIVRNVLEPCGATIELIGDKEDRKNIWVTIGPSDRPGIVLSGHSDVVPVAGQAWTYDPFELTEMPDRFYGRGTADMKAFLACAIALAARATRRSLKTPLHLAISYDEEIGCVGVRSLLSSLETRLVKPMLCIVGEPTSMRVATGHKGKFALRATCFGREAHSALAPAGLNAIVLAADFVSGLRACQEQLRRTGQKDADYEFPYSTIHAGIIRGGEALNIVPARCIVDFELRTIAEDDAEAILSDIRAMADQIVQPWIDSFPEAAISIETMNAYPGLVTTNAPAMDFVAGLIGANDRTKVAFGTEGGFFSEKLDIPVIICGPGSMDQGHKPDEYVTRDQLQRCDRMLDTLLDRLEDGVTL